MGAGASAGKDPKELLTAAEELLGKELLTSSGEKIETVKALEGKKAVALYFSAHWCPPCRGFTPKLAEYYTKDLKEKGLEIVFVSSDRDADSCHDYFKEMPWLALPYSEREIKNKLSAKFKVQGIPTMIILNGADGSIITKDGRSEVMNDPTGENFPWIPLSFKEALGTTFMRGENMEEVGAEAVEGKTLGLYFSAHWCPPCRAFTPQLATWYSEMKKDLGDKFEIVFCTGDADEQSMKSYYSEMVKSGGNWLCQPFSAKGKLDPVFEIHGYPTFIIVDPDGKVINKSGRGLVPKATSKEFPWPPPAIGNIENPEGINDTPSIVLMLESVASDVQKTIMERMTPIAQSYAKQDEPELLFFAATEAGSVSSQIRGMCGLESSGMLNKLESSNDDSAPKLIRTTTSDTPTVILLDIPDNGGYYVGRMAKEMDGSGVKAMIQDWKDKKLERKQLS
eukprot:TRINITY_DN15025_c0_g1_i1.p1 TRINITY_DN15025_c0_g1~~TRINITY_DN15025_c0_g1_i1.p1  ORF type:complete len:452 (-),score=100.95 TRINITY_DN15025_c0_g1_i1:177-1532(-)